jgi:hypothetical protein
VGECGRRLAQAEREDGRDGDGALAAAARGELDLDAVLPPAGSRGQSGPRDPATAGNSPRLGVLIRASQTKNQQELCKMMYRESGDP